MMLFIRSFGFHVTMSIYRYYKFRCLSARKFLAALCNLSSFEPYIILLSSRVLSSQSLEVPQSPTLIQFLLGLWFTMTSTSTISFKELATAGLLAVSTAYLVKRLSQPSNPPLPPGPKSLPIVGHLFSVPRSNEPVAYAKMCKDLNSCAHDYPV